jgi:hypothetical protein
MRRSIHRVGWAAGGLAVLVGSFWITLVVLDRLERVDGRVEDQSQPRNVVFSLIAQGKANWSTATPETTTNVSREGIIVRSTIGTGQYEFVTTDISLAERSSAKPYVLEYDIKASEGAVALGVLDASNDRWVTTYPIVEHRDRHIFTTQATKIRLIVYNNGPGSTQFVIERLALTQN